MFPYTPGHPYSVLRTLQAVAGDISLVKSAGSVMTDNNPMKYRGMSDATTNANAFVARGDIPVSEVT